MPFFPLRAVARRALSKRLKLLRKFSTVLRVDIRRPKSLAQLKRLFWLIAYSVYQIRRPKSLAQLKRCRLCSRLSGNVSIRCRCIPGAKQILTSLTLDADRTLRREGCELIRIIGASPIPLPELAEARGWNGRIKGMSYQRHKAARGLRSTS